MYLNTVKIIFIQPGIGEADEHRFSVRSLHMIEIKRNCSSAVTDRGDRITFGDFTITNSDDDYIKFREAMNKYPGLKVANILEIMISAGLENEI